MIDHHEPVAGALNAQAPKGRSSESVALSGRERP
jgi:hypothetical protein